MSSKSQLEDGFLRVWRARYPSGPMPVRQYKFALEELGRKWSMDFAWPDRKLAVELDGGGWTGGRHSRGDGMREDRERDREATKLGWRILRYVGADLKEKPVQVVEEVAWLLSVLPQC